MAFFEEIISTINKKEQTQIVSFSYGKILSWNIMSYFFSNFRETHELKLKENKVE